MRQMKHVLNAMFHALENQKYFYSILVRNCPNISSTIVHRNATNTSLGENGFILNQGPKYVITIVFDIHVVYLIYI